MIFFFLKETLFGTKKWGWPGHGVADHPHVGQWLARATPYDQPGGGSPKCGHGVAGHPHVGQGVARATPNGQPRGAPPKRGAAETTLKASHPRLVWGRIRPSQTKSAGLGVAP